MKPHVAGKLALTIGNTSDTITVTAEAVNIQLASSEKAAAIDGSQLSNVTLRGRDIFGYLKLIPGVIDNSLWHDERGQPGRHLAQRNPRHHDQREHVGVELRGGWHHRHGYRLQQHNAL